MATVKGMLVYTFYIEVDKDVGPTLTEEEAIAGALDDINVGRAHRSSRTWADGPYIEGLPEEDDECPMCKNGTLGREDDRLVCRGECGLWVTLGAYDERTV